MYGYLIMPNEEIRLYDGCNWIKLDSVKTIGYSEMNSLLKTIKENGNLKNRVKNIEPI